MQSWMEKQLSVSESRIDELIAQREQANLEQRQADVNLLDNELSHAKSQHAWKVWLLDLENRWLPRDPFQTICCIMGVLIFSTLVKHLLMLSSDLLIGHVSTSIVQSLRQRSSMQRLRWIERLFKLWDEWSFGAITAAADGLAAGLMSLFGAAIREPLRSSRA